MSAEPEIDDGVAVHYTAVTRGTPVFAADGVQIGTVVEVVDNYREHILDGFVIERSGDRAIRFVDGPEVVRTAERGVTVSFEAAAAAELPTPQEASPNYRPSWRSRLSSLLGGQ